MHRAAQFTTERDTNIIPVLRALKIVLAFCITLFALAGVYVSHVIFQQQEALREVSRYNMVWAVSQALPEYIRFENRVAAFGLGLAQKNEVKLRLDILYNRVGIFDQSEVKTFAKDAPEQQIAIDELGAVLKQVEPMIDTLERPGTVARALDLLRPLEAKLSRFAAAANQFGGDQVTADQHNLVRLHWNFTLLAGGLFACGLAFIGLLYFHNRLLSKTHAALIVLTEELGLAKTAAEASSAAKSRFLATMSHELRTPLNSIIGFSEIINAETFGPLGEPRYIGYAGNILKAGRHMLEVVNDVLTMARLDAERYQPSLEPVELKRLTDAIVAIFRGTEIGRRHEITVDAGNGWGRIEADSQAVRQMLLNLLSNAAKFSNDNTVIEVGCRSPESGEIWLTVTDHGIGMTAAQIEKVGTPFYQADDRLERRHEGSGLGLSIVAALVRAHGGRLEIASMPGAGTEVSLVFPAAAEPENVELAAVA